MRCRRSSFRLLKILTSSFWRTSPTTKLLLGLHPACLFLPPHFLLPTLLYPNEINESLSQTYPSATSSPLAAKGSPTIVLLAYRSQRAFRRHRDGTRKILVLTRYCHQGCVEIDDKIIAVSKFLYSMSNCT